NLLLSTNPMPKTIFLILIGTIPWCFADRCCAENYELKATPDTVVWGHYSAASKPALKIRSGDTVRIETVSTGSPARFEAAGVAPDRIAPALRQIYTEVKDKGPGGHILTGPVYVEGAQPGDALEVR